MIYIDFALYVKIVIYEKVFIPFGLHVKHFHERTGTASNSVVRYRI